MEQVDFKFNIGDFVSVFHNGKLFLSKIVEKKVCWKENSIEIEYGVDFGDRIKYVKESEINTNI